MVERINKREGKLLAQDELKRALDELKGAEILKENGLYFIRRFSGGPGDGKIFCRKYPGQIGKIFDLTLSN